MLTCGDVVAINIVCILIGLKQRIKAWDADDASKEMVQMWYDEIHKYDFKKPGFKSGTGHFTQVVWKGSTHVGIGIASGRKGTFVVANYEPAGNISNPGYFERNVDPDGTGLSLREKKEAAAAKDRPAVQDSSDSSGSKVETKVKTNIEEYDDAQGRRVRKTTKITTTITTKGSSKSTSTKTEVNTEFVGGGNTTSDTSGVERGISGMDMNDDVEKLSSGEVRKFEDECIARHNELRKKHGVAGLKRSSDLQKKAQKWAEHLVKLRALQHSSGRDVGENLAYKYSSDKHRFNGKEIADMWYNEIKDYDFNMPGFSQKTGHFTQVVWADTREIGVGVAYDGHGTCFAVANYSPPGNFGNKYAENVKRKK